MQIAPEAIVLDFRREITTRAHDEPGLCRDVALASDAAEAPRFEGAEEDGLQLERQGADFAEQQRALARELQSAAEPAPRIGKRAPLRAEEPRFQRDRIRYRRTTPRGTVPARARPGRE
jgi:hypothetical protein